MYRRRAREEDSLARNADGASEKLGVGLKEALAENDDLVAAAAKVRMTRSASHLDPLSRGMVLVSVSHENLRRGSLDCGSPAASSLSS